MEEKSHGSHRQPNSNYLVPISIVIAGALVAGAVFFSKEGSGQAQTGNFPSTKTEEVAITPVGTGDHVRGNPEAPLMLVEYSDTDCPFCQRFHVTMKQLMDEYGKQGSLAWTYRHFPIPQLHPGAPKEAEAMECAAKLGGSSKFWEFADILYQRQRTETDPGHPDLPTVAESIGLSKADFTACLDSGEMKPAVDNEIQDAIDSGGSGTPHNILVLKNEVPKETEQYIRSLQLPADAIAISKDKKRIRIGGAFPIEIMKGIIDSVLK